MPANIYTAADFQMALRNYLPRGRAWPTDPTTVQSLTLLGLAGIYETSAAAAVALIADALPSTTTDLLPEWQASLGLPDPCSSADATTDQQRDQVVARFAGFGGQRVVDYVNFCATLGVEISIEVFAPFRVGIDGAGDPIYSNDWAFTLLITGTATSDLQAVLECEVNRLKGAHLVVLYAMTLPASPGGNLDFSTGTTDDLGVI